MFYLIAETVDTMLITRTDISTLKKLSLSKDLVPLQRIPNAFKMDFDTYFFGKTLVKEDNVLFAYPHDVKNWVRYIFAKYND